MHRLLQMHTYTDIIMFSTIKTKFKTLLTALGYTEQVEFYENETTAQVDKTYSIRCYSLKQKNESKYNLLFLQMGVSVSVNYDLHLGNSYSASLDLLDDVVGSIISPSNYATGVRLIELDGIEININNDTLEVAFKFQVEYTNSN